MARIYSLLLLMLSCVALASPARSQHYHPGCPESCPADAFYFDTSGDIPSCVVIYFIFSDVEDGWSPAPPAPCSTCESCSLKWDLFFAPSGCGETQYCLMV